MQQALDYAETLKIPFVFSSNGDGFVFHDRTGVSTPRESNPGSRRLPVTRRPVGALSRLERANDGESEEIVLQDYHDDGSGKEPRYYQVNAVNAAIEAIAKGQDRVLLVMATGTGKTYTAFQIIWRLWKSQRWNPEGNEARPVPGRPQRPDRPDDGERLPPLRRGDGEAFDQVPRPSNGRTAPRVDLTHRASTGKRRIDTAYEVYLGLYQAITGPEERQKMYKRVLARTSSI